MLLPAEVLAIMYVIMPSDITRFPSRLRVRTAEEFGNGYSLFATQTTLTSETYLYHIPTKYLVEFSPKILPIQF
jgi:hypothetical protein